jgi:UPF0271 protein
VFADKPLTAQQIDLTADVGERDRGSSLELDRALISHISSANIACGAHAGDAAVMRETVRLALEHGVAIGAHPSFPDRDGFGRREMTLPPEAVESLVRAQVETLAGIAAAEGGRMHHVKPHGALFNMAARDVSLADAIARAVRSIDRQLILVGLSGSEIIEAGRRAGLPVASEVFADRAYRPDGSLVARGESGAVIHDADTVVARAVQMARMNAVTAVDGTVVQAHVDTICVHGDTPGAVELARRIRRALRAAGVVVKAVGA